MPAARPSHLLLQPGTGMLHQQTGWQRLAEAGGRGRGKVSMVPYHPWDTREPLWASSPMSMVLKQMGTHPWKCCRGAQVP